MMISLSAGEQVLNPVEIKKLEKNPEVYVARGLPLPTICQTIRWANRLYGKGTKGISDRAYDALTDELKKRKPTHPLLKQVGHVTPTARNKVPLPYPLYSLDKIKPGEGTVGKWSAGHKGPYTLSDKEDGNSLEIVIKRGQPTKVYTRGKDNVGQDVSHIAPYLNIPQKLNVDLLVVRGEAIMPVSLFAKFSKETLGDKEGYDNPRNLVAGAIGKLKVKHEAFGSIHFIAYEIIEPRKFKPSQAFAKLKQLGFQIAWYSVVPKIDDVSLSNILVARKLKSKYEMDGLVVEQDQINKRPPVGTHHPDYAIAFKMTAEDAIKEVRVLEIDWNDSQHGKVIPRVMIEPTRLSGVTVDFANGHNAFFIKHGYRSKDRNKGLPIRPLGKGAVVRVTRAGDVIPHIVSVVKGVKTPDFPTGAWHWEGQDIVRDVQSDTSKLKLLTAFFTTVKIDFIKIGTVQRMVDAGLDSVSKIINASVADFQKVEGWKGRMAQKIHDAIHAKLDKIELPTLMDASKQFPESIGTRRAAMVLKAIPNIMQMANLPEKQLVAKIMQVPQFKETTATMFAKGLPKFVIWMNKVGIKPIMPRVVKPSGSKMKDQKVCFTGVRSAELEAEIVKQGGEIASGVSKGKTTILIAKDPSGTSAKNQKAHALGIPVLTIDQFKQKYKL